MSGNKKSGRKPKAEAERADKAITAWMTADDKELIEKAAAVARVPAGRWLGNIGVERARSLLGVA
jgi:hypothetical protein